MPDKSLPALIALTVTVLFGLPGQVLATTVDCYPTTDPDLRPPTGHVDMWAAVDQSDSAYHLFSYTIRRGYSEYDEVSYPLQNGFCFFDVPELARPAIACTLYYYQTGHQGSAGLRVNWMYGTEGTSFNWPPDSIPAFWYAWNDTVIVATDVSHSTDNAWYAVPLTTEGRQKINDIGYGSGGGPLLTGWTYRDFVDGTYAEVAGFGSGYEPRIHVVY
jgi:hypothetical protein